MSCRYGRRLLTTPFSIGNHVFLLDISKILSRLLLLEILGPASRHPFTVNDRVSLSIQIFKIVMYELEVLNERLIYELGFKE